MKLIIKDTLILSMVNEEIKKANIYIDNKKIVHIGKDYRMNADRIIDGSNFLTMPGFINSHTHVGMSLFRNYGNDNNLMTWLNDYIFPAEEKLNPDLVYYASLISFAEMIKTGTTTFADMYFFEEATIKALELAKLRGQISRGLSSPDEDNYRLKENIELYTKYNGKDGKLEIGMGPHAVYTTDESYLNEISDIAKRYDMPIHIHLSETEFENEKCQENYGKSPTELFNDCSIFESRAIAAHGVHLSDNDLKILSKKNVSLIHNPSSNLKLSSGIMDVTRVMDSGVNVCLGTDSAASNNKQSMLKEIEIAALISKLKSADNLKAYDVLKMATINGAKALGLDHKVGTIEVGKEADIILVDINNINHIPHNDLISSLCYSTYDSDIKYVLVAGEVLLDNGKLVYIDESELIDKARSLTRDLL